MTLSEKDGQLFYKLWLPLLDYVNEKCKVNKNVKDMANAKSLDPQVVKEIANVLWDDVSIIDQYLIDQRADMPDEHKEIISSWKRRGQRMIRCIRFRELYPVGKKCFSMLQCHY